MMKQRALLLLLCHSPTATCHPDLSALGNSVNELSSTSLEKRLDWCKSWYFPFEWDSDKSKIEQTGRQEANAMDPDDCQMGENGLATCWPIKCQMYKGWQSVKGFGPGPLGAVADRVRTIQRAPGLLLPSARFELTLESNHEELAVTESSLSAAIEDFHKAEDQMVKLNLVDKWFTNKEEKRENSVVEAWTHLADQHLMVVEVVSSPTCGEGEVTRNEDQLLSSKYDPASGTSTHRIRVGARPLVMQWQKECVLHLACAGRTVADIYKNSKWLRSKFEIDTTDLEQCPVNVKATLIDNNPDAVPRAAPEGEKEKGSCAIM